MIRVDHAGEFGAVRIYEGQLAVLGGRKSKAVDAIREMAEQEQRHLKRFDALINERRVRPTALEPIWRVAGFALGAATALMGEKAAMACTAAVEEVIDKLNKDPHLILVDEANHLNVAALEVMRHIHDMTECGMVLVATQRLYDLFTNGGRKSQDLEQLWSRVGIHDLLPGLAPSEVGQIAKASMSQKKTAAQAHDGRGDVRPALPMAHLAWGNVADILKRQRS